MTHFEDIGHAPNSKRPPTLKMEAFPPIKCYLWKAPIFDLWW